MKKRKKFKGIMNIRKRRPLCWVTLYSEEYIFLNQKTLEGTGGKQY